MSTKCVAAEKLYQNDPKVNRGDVKILQNWLIKQPHLPKLEESQVIIFLHSCCYSIEATKITIDKYFTRRTLYPEIFLISSTQMIRKACSVVFNNILPKKTPQGYPIYMGALIDFKAENYNFVNELILINCLTLLHLHQHGSAKGLVVILDSKKFSLAHMARVNLSAFRHTLQHFEEGIPVRIKEIHVVNIIPFMDKILSLVKPMMSNELFDMIQLHSSFETLHKCVPKECLPEDIGGELPSYQKMKDLPLNEILDNLDLLEWHQSQTVDESKRTETTNIIGSNFGIQGTFKKLEID